MGYSDSGKNFLNIRYKTMYKPRRVARKPRVPRKKRVVRTIKPTPAFKKEVLAIVKPRTMNKYIAYQHPTYVASTGINTSGGAGLVPMIPILTQGVDENQRIADRILPSKLRTHITMYLPKDQYCCDLYVRLICVTNKEVKAYALSASIPGRDLFNLGDGTTQDVPVGGGALPSLDNLERWSKVPVNTKNWSVLHDKTYRLTKGLNTLFDGSAQTSSPVLPSLEYHHIVLNTPHKGQLKYDGALTQFPNNFAPVWCAFYWSADGNTGLMAPQIASRSELYFTDN